MKVNTNYDRWKIKVLNIKKDNLVLVILETDTPTNQLKIPCWKLYCIGKIFEISILVLKQVRKEIGSKKISQLPSSFIPELVGRIWKDT